MTTHSAVSSQKTYTKSWGIMIFLSYAIVFYGFSVILSGSIQGPLETSFNDRPLVFWFHIFFGAIALATGSVNGARRIVRKYRSLHIWNGRVYVVSVVLSAMAGLIMAPFSAIGIVDHLGFGLLAILWFTTTVMGYFRIRGRRVADHRKWMMRSVALTLAAVTLRIWNPLLIISSIVIFGVPGDMAFDVAYPYVAWLCWVPNLIVVELVLRRRNTVGLSREMSDLASTLT